MTKTKYHYLVPVIKTETEASTYKRPRIPKGLGFAVIEYQDEKVIIAVSKRSHRYLKNRIYATFLGEINHD